MQSAAFKRERPPSLGERLEGRAGVAGPRRSCAVSPSPALPPRSSTAPRRRSAPGCSAKGSRPRTRTRAPLRSRRPGARLGRAGAFAAGGSTARRGCEIPSSRTLCAAGLTPRRSRMRFPGRSPLGSLRYRGPLLERDRPAKQAREAVRVSLLETRREAESADRAPVRDVPRLSAHRDRAAGSESLGAPPRDPMRVACDAREAEPKAVAFGSAAVECGRVVAEHPERAEARERLAQPPPRDRRRYEIGRRREMPRCHVANAARTVGAAPHHRAALPFALRISRSARTPRAISAARS